MSRGSIPHLAFSLPANRKVLQESKNRDGTSASHNHQRVPPESTVILKEINFTFSRGRYRIGVFHTVTQIYLECTILKPEKFPKKGMSFLPPISCEICFVRYKSISGHVFSSRSRHYKWALSGLNRKSR